MSNVGAKAEQKIKEKYQVSDVIQEEFDEYGHELQFSDDEEESEEEVKGADDEPEAL